MRGLEKFRVCKHNYRFFGQNCSPLAIVKTLSWLSWQPKFMILIVSTRFAIVFLYFVCGRTVTYTPLNTGIHGNDADEERTVNADLQELASSSSALFSPQASSARVLLTLRHRVRQVSGVMGMCHAALLNAYTAMFPLDERPHGIFRFADRKSVV